MLKRFWDWMGARAEQDAAYGEWLAGRAMVVGGAA